MVGEAAAGGREKERNYPKGPAEKGRRMGGS